MDLFTRIVVKRRKLIVIICLLLIIPCALGFIKTRVNYDMLSYLPKNIESVKGQDILLDDFGKGSFAMILFEGMDEKDVAKTKAELEKLEHVDSVIWYDSIADITIPMDMLPDNIYKVFNRGDCTMMAAFLDDSISSESSMETIEQMRKIAGKQCWISSMSAYIEDLKVLVEHEMPIYVVLAVVMACIILMILMDSFLIPFIFIASIGMAIIYNMGTNVFKGEISFITMALAAVLQLGVTMDYSIFLWHSYKEEKKLNENHEEAMQEAIKHTIASVSASSLTTVAGFIALCFMSYTLGLDLGIVMAKGVVIGVIASVTLLPSLILVMDKPIAKTMHKPINLSFNKTADFILKRRRWLIVIFIIIMIPAAYGYSNVQVYYNLDQSLPKSLKCVQANEKLNSTFNMDVTNMVLCDSDMESKDAKEMIDRIKAVDGVKDVIGKDAFIGNLVPTDILPSDLTDTLQANGHQLLIITNKYKVATYKAHKELKEINSIIREYDDKAMLIGEAPCTEDLIKITNHDFKVVSMVSIGAVMVLIFLALQSVSIPFILVAVIEFAIFINLGIPFYTGVRLPFIASICISTIQLGATVDYAILMTNRYKKERLGGQDKNGAVITALKTSMPSIITSGLCFFFATFGVGIYSDIDIIGSLCGLMARGSIISMVSVILILPPLFMIFDKIICKTTRGMTHIDY